MTASLVLLGVFLLFYLKKTWDDELAALKKETSHLFMHSIHSIEGEVLDKIVFNRLYGRGDSSMAFLHRRIDMEAADSLKVFAFTGDRKMMVKKDSSFTLNVQTITGLEESGGDEMVGSLSMVIELTDSEWVSDTSHVADIFPLIESNFDKNFEGSGLPVAYKVVRLSDDSILPHKALLSGAYTDLPSGQRFAAELTDYKGYVFRQMLPEVLFSLGLFGCVGLAFFTIFNNLQAQRRLTELKNDFISNVTHELKTPIATVGVAIEALRDFDAMKDPGRSKEYLDISRSELGRLSLLVDKVLRLSQFEKSEPELNLETLDMKNLVAEILASMRLQFEKQGAVVSFSAEGENFTLSGDRLHLASVVYNLLDNALKYSPAEPVISVQLTNNGRQVALKVKDNGAGIPAAYKDKVFDKFFRVPAGDTHNVKGHGLGLSYAASVVRKHGGTVGVESKEGAGSCFTVTLPMAMNSEQ
jgi:signal transduction histidine kinase